MVRPHERRDNLQSDHAASINIARPRLKAWSLGDITPCVPRIIKKKMLIDGLYLIMQNKNPCWIEDPGHRSFSSPAFCNFNSSVTTAASWSCRCHSVMNLCETREEKYRSIKLNVFQTCLLWAVLLIWVSLYFVFVICSCQPLQDEKLRSTQLVEGI